LVDVHDGIRLGAAEVGSLDGNNDGETVDFDEGAEDGEIVGFHDDATKGTLVDFQVGRFGVGNIVGIPDEDEGAADGLEVIVEVGFADVRDDE